MCTPCSSVVLLPSPGSFSMLTMNLRASFKDDIPEIDMNECEDVALFGASALLFKSMG